MLSTRILAASRVSCRAMSTPVSTSCHSITMRPPLSKILPSRSCLPRLYGATMVSIHTRHIHSTSQTRDPTPTVKEASSATITSLTPPPSWLDKLPTSLKWTRPYFELSRLDKPIGSWLLYWPCGGHFITEPRSRTWKC